MQPPNFQLFLSQFFLYTVWNSQIEFSVYCLTFRNNVCIKTVDHNPLDIPMFSTISCNVDCQFDVPRHCLCHFFYQITTWLGWWSSSHNSQLLLKCFYHDRFNIPLQNATFQKSFLWKFSPFCISHKCAVLLIMFLKNLLMYTFIQITVFIWQHNRLEMNVK